MFSLGSSEHLVILEEIIRKLGNGSIEIIQTETLKKKTIAYSRSIG